MPKSTRNDEIKSYLRLPYSSLFGSAVGSSRTHSHSRRQNRTANQIQPVAEASFATATKEDE